jgi:DNA-binding XRE family transcriptional regulator
MRVVSSAYDADTAAAFRAMLKQDREQRGFTVGQVAWRLGISWREYVELESGSALPNFEVWDRMCKLFGWPQTFYPARRL